EKEEKSRRKDLELQQKMFDHSLRRDKVTQYDNYVLKESWRKERKRVLKVLDRVTLEKPRFGKSYYKIEIEESDLESLKQDLNQEL
uniref:hypothetical protein n=1 Tax=Ulvibacterium sp. TaxID=2665914 RepID=UPI00262B1E49